METKNETKTLVLTVIAVLTLVVMVVGATYAYFQAQAGPNASVETTISTNTTDSLAFTMGNAITFSADQSNFASGKKSLFGETTATANLKANNATNSATYNYNIALNITSNGFSYTTPSSTAELILSVTKPDGQPLTTLSGYNYVTVSDSSGASISGFDITTKTGSIPIASNYAITSNSSSTITTESWKFRVTFVNLNSDQQGNTGKDFNGTISITKAL